jgi:hypothetical protein
MKIVTSIIVTFLPALLFMGCSNSVSTGEAEITNTATQTPVTNTGTPETETSATPEITELPPSDYLPEVPRVSIHDVKVKIDSGANILIVDSRETEDYNKSHITGAVSKTEAIALEGYEEIITYCQ